VKLWMLGSGSDGNAVLIECDGSRILVDAGFGGRVLAGRLKSIGVDPRSIDACFVTHEHTDHAKGACGAARRWGWTLFASPGTAASRELSRAPVTRFIPGATVELARMIVETTPTPHDAAQSTGFVVTSRSTGARAAIFSDIGHVTPRITAACRNADILVIESNHDEIMLRNGPYPRSLKARIASPIGHLSNRAAAFLARDVATRDTRHVILAHLSRDNNTPAVATRLMTAQLARTHFRGLITAAEQDAVVGPFTPGPRRAEQPTQFELGL